MGFAGVYTALYDYQPQTGQELGISEGDLLYVIDNDSNDGWWKAKKKTTEIDAEEPVGLVPNNYVEEATPIQKASSLYDYTRQTDEEVSFTEGAEILIFDTSDPDWTLVRVNAECGFAPANYIEVTETIQTPDHSPEVPPALPRRTREPEPEPEPDAAGTTTHASPSPSSPAGPAAAIAGILHQQRPSVSGSSRPVPPPPSAGRQQSATVYTPEESDDTPPPVLPKRPVSQLPSPPKPSSPPPEPSPRDRLAVQEDPSGVQPSPPYSRVASEAVPLPSNVSPSGYHIYNISEMVSVMGKRKKMPTTLGINVTTGKIFISPEKSEDGLEQEWTADRLTHYSIEHKHVFVDLVRPSKSVDFHAGAKDTAQEIVSALGEISGGYKAEGLREVIAAGAGGAKKKGQVLYDFVAQGDDEVTVAVGDEVVILDDKKSDEWWMVRRMKNGDEGVVPSNYVEISGLASEPEPSYSGANAGRSAVEQNRLEEERLAKQSGRKSRRQDSGDARTGEVGPGMKLPQRASSLFANNDGNKQSQRQKRDSKSSKPKPNQSKTRKWTDRSGTFSVVAEFIGMTDGKIHLHKVNGVKIAVPTAKMSVEDLEYVEKATGVSLDEDKPLSDIRRRSQTQGDAGKPGASVQPKSDFDWFDFFLKAGVGPHQCERYAQNFAKDSMDEGILPDITSENLRTLGLKEGDILRVMKHLDNQYRNGKTTSLGGDGVSGNEQNGGLFSGPGGTLRNNTRKGRPAPSVQTSDIVDPKAFGTNDGSSKPSSPDKPTPSPAKDQEAPKGFEDNAWEVKHPPSQTATTSAAPAQTQQAQPSVTGAMADLSLLQAPLQPAKTSSAPQPAPSQLAFSQPPPTQPSQASQQQTTGATPSFFSQLGQPQQAQGISPQMTGYPAQQPPPPQQAQQQQPAMAPRQRPQPPPTANQGSLLPPPPQRPLSAPQNAGQQDGFGQQKLQPQLTGYVPQSQFGNQLVAQHTGAMTQQQQQPSQTGFQPQMGFANGQQQSGFQNMQPQPTGYAGFSQPQQQQTMPTLSGSFNASLPSALQSQPTGVGANGLGGNTSFTPSPPPIPQQSTAQPLQPQKTGPAPSVRFGVRHEMQKLAPDSTGRRANLSQASPANPFGF